MLGGILMVVAIATFIMVHEAGHFVTARLTGMKATEFFLGFGPKIWSFQRGETEFGVKAIPFGGYVRIIGMNPLEEIEPEDVGRTYQEQVFWKKAVVVLSGVVLNFAMAFLLLFGLFWATGIAGDVTTTVSAVSQSLVNGDPTPAVVSGVQAGDRILTIDDVAVDTWEGAVALIADRADQTVPIEVERDGSPVLLTVTLASIDRETADAVETVGFLGVSPEVEIESVGPFRALGLAGRTEVEVVRLSFVALGRIIRPSSLIELGGALFGNTDISPEIRPVSPIGLVQIGSQAQSIGFDNVVFILASVNIILGIFNGLPLYPLDGGHFAVALFEKISGREVNVRRLIPIAAAVITLMLFLGVVAIVLDLVNPISLQ